MLPMAWHASHPLREREGFSRVGQQELSSGEGRFPACTGMDSMRPPREREGTPCSPTAARRGPQRHSRVMMPDLSHLAWPFFDDAHRGFARDLSAWARAELAGAAEPERDAVDARCRELVRAMGEAGWLRA